jgi:hypothetical protein
VLSGGKTLDCDVVVCATGFDKSYDGLFSSKIENKADSSDGSYIYRNVVPWGGDTQQTNLFFCGSECGTLYNITASALQAEWISRIVSGEMQLPTSETMQVWFYIPLRDLCKFHNYDIFISYLHTVIFCVVSLYSSIK